MKMYLVSLSAAAGETVHYLLDKVQWDSVRAAEEAGEAITKLFRNNCRIPSFASTMALVEYLNYGKIELVDELQDLDFIGVSVTQSPRRGA